MAPAVYLAVVSLLTCSWKLFTSRQCFCALNELVMRVLDSRAQACTNRFIITVFFASWVKTLLLPHLLCLVVAKKKKRIKLHCTCLNSCSFSELFTTLKKSSDTHRKGLLHQLSQQYLTLCLFNVSFPSAVMMRNWLFIRMSTKCLLCKSVTAKSHLHRSEELMHWNKAATEKHDSY